MTLFTDGESRLKLPVRRPAREDGSLAPFAPVELSAPLAVERLRLPSRGVEQRRDVIDGVTTIRLEKDNGRLRFSGHGLEHDSRSVETYRIQEDDPLSAAVRIEHRSEYQRGEWRVRIETDSDMRSDGTHFYLTNRVDAYEGEAPVFSHVWSARILRDHV